MTSFGSHRRNTDRSLKVSISSYRHRSDLVWWGNVSGETIVDEEEQSPVVARSELMSECHLETTGTPVSTVATAQ